MNEPAPITEPAVEHRAMAAPASGSRLKGWQLVVAALIAAGLAWPFLKRYERAFPMENLTVEMTNRIRARADDPIAWAKERQNQWESLYRNAGLNLGIFGLCLGGCLGLVAGATGGRTILTTLRGLAYGAVLGTAAGIAAGFSGGAVALYLGNAKGMDVSLRSSLIHAAGWAVPGLACGLILGLASGQRSLVRPAIGGLIGGLTAAFFYEPVAGMLFQLDRTDIPVPEGTGNKFLFLGAAAVLMTFGAWSADNMPTTRRASPRA